MKNNDYHLNVFYSYNRDNELIENNITRAFIVTLRLLSQHTSQLLLIRLLKSKSILNDEDLSFVKNLSYALQDNIPISTSKLKKIPQKYIITLTGNNIIEGIGKFKKKGAVKKLKVSSRIKPDAWIFDRSKTPEFCFLIECKTIGDTLTAEQIFSYAKHFFGLNKFDDIERRLIQITWYDILEVCESLITDNQIKNEQEGALIKDLIEFLGYCEVKLFKGIDFFGIPELPEYDLSAYTDFCFEEIPDLPDYRIVENE